MLSLVNGTPTIAMDNWNSYNDELPSKIKDVYTRLGLLNHYISCEYGFGAEQRKKLLELTERFKNEPDTDIINNAIIKERESYSNFVSQIKKWI